MIFYPSPLEADGHRAFSLIELLVAMAVLGLMAALMLSVLSSSQKISKQTSSRTEQYREARRAFERINQRLAQATLNSYWDYVDSSGSPRTTNNASTFVPKNYFRISELRYLQTNATTLSAAHGGATKGQAVFFQAPLGQVNSAALTGMNFLLNTVGYFIEKGSDESMRPPTVTGPAKNRYRLYEMVEPSENLTVYSLTSENAAYSGSNWFTVPLVAANSHRLADNIVALLFRADYTDGSTPKSVFTYTSAPKVATTQAIEENNLPPSVRVTMVAVDESSARRIQDFNLTLTDAQDDAGLVTLEGELIANHLNYQKFESSVKIGPSKWSSK
jgi:uncharacterized protein (TIGR02599 family)